MQQFSEAQIAQMAPDAGSLKSGRDLANIRKWVGGFAGVQALWGEIQGSGKDPYRTAVDLRSPAFKCSCPSRKFPCKHGLGLLFMYAQGQLKAAENAPEWVSEWLLKREQNAEAKAEKASPAPVEDPKKAREKAKREQDRLQLVQAGAAELELLLRDLLRTGLMQVPEKGAAFFDKTLRRMVDAKAAGLANFVRNFVKINYLEGNSWQSETLENATRCWLLLQAFKQIDEQTPLRREQLRQLLGWTLPRKDLQEHPLAEKVGGQWLSLCRRVEPLDDTLQVQRIWLYEPRQQRFAVLLDYAPPHLPFSTVLPAGLYFNAEVLYFPAVLPQRALLLEQGEGLAQIPDALPALAHWREAQQELATALGRMPWLESLPQIIDALVLVPHGQGWALSDREGRLVPLCSTDDEQALWRLLAISGGYPFQAAVLRQGDSAEILGIFQDKRYISV
jgi:hypothetical protein